MLGVELELTMAPCVEVPLPISLCAPMPVTQQALYEFWCFAVTDTWACWRCRGLRVRKRKLQKSQEKIDHLSQPKATGGAELSYL